MPRLSYKTSGVNIDQANAAKRQMAKILNKKNPRVLNKVGAFASLFDGSFSGYQHPVLVLKTEEPGSKQKLAIQHGSVESICYDLVNHLINDAIVMGARPLSVQDCIVCGKLKKTVILEMVKAISAACQKNGCVLTGGETSEQPGVVPKGTYILTASVMAVVEKKDIIDGSKIKTKDVVLALASSGVHTNGFSLIRKIIKQSPGILKQKIGGKNFIQTVLIPHRCYYNALKGLFGNKQLTGLAHITGGGIKENLNRILPKHLDAEIDLSRIKILPVFKVIKKFSHASEQDLLRTFNLGVGLTAVVRQQFTIRAITHLKKFGIDAYEIGKIQKGRGEVKFRGHLAW